MLVRSALARWLAAFLLLASPAVGGQVLSVVHPCAVETTERDPHASHGSGHDQAPADARCTCIGSCQVAALASLPRGATIVTAVVGHPTQVVLVTAPESVPVAERPIDRLPPPTAPPLA